MSRPGEAPGEGQPSATSPDGAPPSTVIDATVVDATAIDPAAVGPGTGCPAGADAASPPPAAPVLTRIVRICNRRGLHARAAAKFVTMAERFGASVEVARDGQTVSARSIMGLMMLGAGTGSEIELRAEGWDAHEALDALGALIEAGFNEQD